MKRMILGLLFAGGVYAALDGNGINGLKRNIGNGIFLSPVYNVDRRYKSMSGPSSTQPVSLKRLTGSELVWVTGFKAVMVASDGKTPAPQEYMCHSNLDFDVARHAGLFGWKKRVSSRLFTLSQGQAEIRFPPGLGIPLLSDEVLRLNTQVLNLNEPNPGIKTRHRINVEHVRDSEAGPMKPLYATGVYGLAVIPGQDPVLTRARTAAGTILRPSADKNTFLYDGTDGLKYTGHWIVKPGREVNRNSVTAQLALPFDTTVHSIAAHLHPFAESLELRDVTLGRTIFRSRALNLRGRIGLASVDTFSSAEGIPLYKSHEYELISVYNNTSGSDQDSMAVLLMYLHDKEYRRPSKGV